MKNVALLAVILLAFSAQSSPCLSAITTKGSVTTELNADIGKKKQRRGKRANKKRKRRCHRAARRNFAG